MRLFVAFKDGKYLEWHKVAKVTADDKTTYVQSTERQLGGFATDEVLYYQWLDD